MLAERYLQNALKVVDRYQGEMPLAIFLKQYFKTHPQMGSRDRKVITELCYDYFRTGKALETDQRVKMLTGLFLAGGKWAELISDLKPEWSAALHYSLTEKIHFLENVFPELNINSVFPWIDHLSDNIDVELLLKSFLIQPDLFIRIRKNKAAIIKKLQAAGILFEEINKNSLALAPQTKLQQVLPEESLYEVQDLSSQKTGDFFQPLNGQDLWDACAGSGGKSILLQDLRPDVNLLVTDKRKSILANLKNRFKTAGIKNYECLQLDLTKSLSKLGNRRFDAIILDAPCSGSGTWSRTPEQLYYFKGQQIAHFQQLQKQIADNIIPFLKKNGVLIYITCSVFKAENEEVVNHILQQDNLQLESQQLITGYQQKADSMFVARMQREV